MAAAAAASRPLPPAPVFSAARATRVDWQLFDSTILMGEVTDPAAACAASNGGEVRVSLRLAKPPASSYVEMHIDAELYDKPTVLSADGDLLLIHTVLAVRDPPPCSYQDNFFVYREHPAKAPPSLQLLPQFGEWGCRAVHTGISCRDGEFVVAAFHTDIVGGGEGTASWGEAEDGASWDEVGVLSRFSSSTGQWEVKELPIPFDSCEALYPFTWHTDKVFSLRGFTCWVDYHRGILYCDAFSDLPELRFVQLPGIEIWDDLHDYSYGRQKPVAYRTVEVSEGIVKFVDVDNGQFGLKKRSGFSVTSWTLRSPELEWEKDGVLQVDDLWSLEKFRDSPLPRWVPEFPVVNKHDSDVLHFVLRGARSSAKAWVISVSMRQKVLKSYMPYTNDYTDLPKEEEDLDLTSLFFDSPFICADLYKDQEMLMDN
ncbi:unnamed protein product [Urochloa decumbens]|uniref:DUF1618 domain-containing protein n=1 Tax=Urochloa decumbens TaxID=240449 RepID=A0ABC8Z9M1_9POAL